MKITQFLKLLHHNRPKIKIIKIQECESFCIIKPTNGQNLDSIIIFEQEVPFFLIYGAANLP